MSSAPKGSSRSHLRLPHECASERDPLALPSRQLMGPACLEPLQLDQGERVVDPSIPLHPRKPQPAQAIGDVVAHIEVWEDRIVLKHHVDRPAIGRNGGHGVTVDLDLACARRLEARDQPQQRGLPAARWAEQGEELALLDLQVDRVNGSNVPEPLREIAQRNEAGAAHRTTTASARRCRLIHSARTINNAEARRMQAPSARTLGSFLGNRSWLQM